MGIQVKELISVRQEMTMPIGPNNKRTKLVLMTHHSFKKQEETVDYCMDWGYMKLSIPPPTPPGEKTEYVLQGPFL